MTFGNALRKRRLGLALSLRKIAREFDVSDQAFGDWEKGKYVPSNENLIKLREKFSDLPRVVASVESNAQAKGKKNLNNWRRQKSKTACSKSASGNHRWQYHRGSLWRFCSLCNQPEKKNEPGGSEASACP